jgi:hypothetical protein
MNTSGKIVLTSPASKNSGRGTQQHAIACRAYCSKTLLRDLASIKLIVKHECYVK